MQRRPFVPSLASATFVALATSMLAACGPGDGAPSQAAAANTPTRPAEAAQARDSIAPPPVSASADNVDNGIGSSIRNASNAPNAATAAGLASNAVAGVQASLAADSQQVAPVLSYAPGDGPPPTSTGTDSSSTATTNQ